MSSRKKKKAATQRPSSPPGAKPRAQMERRPTLTTSGGDVFTTAIAIVAAVAVGVSWMTPLIVTAPYVVYRLRQGRTEGLFRRWATTVLVATAIAATFVPWHTFQSVLMGHSIPHNTHLWMQGSAGAPMGARFMLVAGVLYVVAALASVGVGGALVLSAVLSINAVYAVNLGANAFNVVQVALVAIPPWQWCFIAGLYVLFAPLSAISRERVIRSGPLARPGGVSAPAATRTRALAIGFGLVAAAFLLRLVTLGAYAALVRRWTVF